MLVDWNIIKRFIDERGLSPQSIPINEGYHIKVYDNSFSLECILTKRINPVNLQDFVDNYLSKANKSLNTNVTTATEQEDKRLKIAKGEATFDGTGIATIVIKVPTGGRCIAGGYAFTDNFYAGDYISEMFLVDIDNVFGYGPEVKLAIYCDLELPADQQGWYFEPHAPNNGYIEIEPIGGYGYMPAGTYLKICAKKHPNSTANKCFINIWWGKKS